MKVNLQIPGEESLAGYRNCNPFTDEFQDEIDDAELEELRSIDVLGYFPAKQSETLLDLWIRKLAHGGRLVLGFVDLIEVAKYVSRYKIDVDEANAFLYGEQEKEWQYKKAIFTIPQVSAYLESKGLVITKKRVEDGRAILEAQRP